MKKSLIFISLLVITLSLNAQEVFWLKGSWKGTDDRLKAFTQPSWEIEFTYTNSPVKIYYPTFPCRSEWTLESFDTRSATFTEKLTYGNDKWTDGRIVIVERLENNYCRLEYFDPTDPDKKIAIGLMIRQ